MPALNDLSVGQEIGSTTIDISRADLVRYAGASGDFNPIHWNDRFAEQVGLPGVIAHGMFTMGAAVQLVTDWADNPAAVVDYQTRFTKPVVVENLDTGGATLEVTGVIGAIDEANSSVRVDLTVTAAGQKVLVKAQAVVRAW
ncbi:MaoC family dehydratase [Arthrobacter sp. VKM Ac-2550]|uniref:MaoC family dehydratase n=1 Tax=Crystallibacter permensis TaxID=1938888 RepID=UPI0022418634|nr:Acyl dehydratase [Arthrobacter sp. VKM Ac-2550]